ncbi:MAG: hypothetical protein M3446_09945 [Actinomycetota bacterium]|nr:hypothetical protein [Actinomycetota bacterium]
MVATVLDPVLVPLGFAAGQTGAGATQGQVNFCRGLNDSIDGGCADLVVDLEAAPQWHITSVRYDGFPSERWSLRPPLSTDLERQLAALARTLPADLA